MFSQRDRNGSALERTGAIEPTDVAAQRTRLGTFAGGALTFVRELLRGEAVAYRELVLPARDGEPCADVWVGADEHARAAALLAAAQADAEAAAQRETAALAADEARAAAERARAADAEARNRAKADRRAARIAARHAARIAARHAADEARRHTRRYKDAHRLPSPPLERSAADGAVRILGIALSAFILVLALVIFIGERYGTHVPTPGHHGHVAVCHSRWQVICY